MLLSIMRGAFKRKKDSFIEQIDQAKKDERVMNDLLIAFTPYIKKTASFVCDRFITEHDDEFSIAITAFHEAVMRFDSTEKASLHTFAHLVIKRRLIDYLRKEEAQNRNVQFVIEEAEAMDGQASVFDETAITNYVTEQRQAERNEELKEYTEVLKQYGVTFEELVQCSPKHVSSRRTAFQLAQIIAETPAFYIHLTGTKKLPMKQLASTVDVSRKTIERHRKYIIAITLLMKSDFTRMKEYVKGEFV